MQGGENSCSKLSNTLQTGFWAGKEVSTDWQTQWQQEVRKISAEEIRILVVSGVLGAVVGGSGITGLLFFFIRRYIENKLGKRETEEKLRRDQKIKRMIVDDKLQHCEGRLFFWIHKAIVTGEHNGDLERAFEEYQKAERERKTLDREIVVENELE